jgi:hypothetical protein
MVMKRIILTTLLAIPLLFTACEANEKSAFVNSTTMVENIDLPERRDISITDENIKTETEAIAKKFINALLVWDEEILIEITDPQIIKTFNDHPEIKREFSISKQGLKDYDFTMENIEDNFKIVDDTIVIDTHNLVSMKSKTPSFTGNYNHYKYDYKISLDIDPYIMRVKEVTWNVIPYKLKIN